MMVDLDRVIGSALKSGRMFFGSKQTIRASESRRTVALIVASNCPTKTLTEIKNRATLLKIPVFMYPGSNSDLGVTCRKRFAISALAIREINDDAILRMVRESNESAGS